MGVLENSQFRMLATDPRGTTLADVDGAIKMASAYGVRGERPDLSEALDYAEKGFDPQLQLVRMGVRDYDPVLGQFTTPGPLFRESIEACAKSPVECNLFGYALGNPVSYVDPMGLNGTPSGTVTPGDSAAYDEKNAQGHLTDVVFGANESDVRAEVDRQVGERVAAGEITPPSSKKGNSKKSHAATKVEGSPEGHKDGVKDGATRGELNVPNQQPILDGEGWFGRFSERVTRNLPKVTSNTKQAINGAMILASVFSGARAGMAVVKGAARGVKSGFQKAWNFIRCKNSFAAGTLVVTLAGLTPIEELEAGDLVWSRDEVTGEEDWRPVAGTIEGGGEVIELTVRSSTRSETLTVTPNHPMALAGGGWVDAGELEVGDRLQSAGGEELLVVGVKALPHIPVFNFEVAEYHTYFVGESGAWAHNCPTKKRAGHNGVSGPARVTKRTSLTGDPAAR